MNITNEAWLLAGIIGVQVALASVVIYSLLQENVAHELEQSSLLGLLADCPDSCRTSLKKITTTGMREASEYDMRMVSSGIALKLRSLSFPQRRSLRKSLYRDYNIDFPKLTRFMRRHKLIDQI